MKSFFRFLLVAIIAASASLSANAQSAVSAPYKNALHELMALTKVREVTAETLATTYDNMGLKFTVPTQQVVNTMLDKVWDSYIEDAAEIYSKYYSLSELRQLCDFYRTPLGMKVTKVTPEINRECLSIMQKYQSRFTEVLMQYLQK